MCWNIGVKLEGNCKVGRLNTKELDFDLLLRELKKIECEGPHKIEHTH